MLIKLFIFRKNGSEKFLESWKKEINLFSGLKYPFLRRLFSSFWNRRKKGNNLKKIEILISLHKFHASLDQIRRFPIFGS